MTFQCYVNMSFTNHLLPNDVASIDNSYLNLYYYGHMEMDFTISSILLCLLILILPLDTPSHNMQGWRQGRLSLKRTVPVLTRRPFLLFYVACEAPSSWPCVMSTRPTQFKVLFTPGSRFLPASSHPALNVAEGLHTGCLVSLSFTFLRCKFAGFGLGELQLCQLQ